MSVYEWNCTYGRHKLSKTADVFDPMGRYVTTLPAGTYVDRGVKYDGNMRAIDWMYSDGTKGTGGVLDSVVIPAFIDYYDTNGRVTDIHELKFYEKVKSGEIDPSKMHFAAGDSYLNDVYNTPWASGKTESTAKPESTSPPAATKQPSSAATKAPSTKKSSSSSNKTSAPRITATPKPSTATVTYQGAKAEIDILSSYESVIEVNGERLTVLTSELEFASTAKEEERLAVIYAPRTGKATMREKASQNAKMVKNCKAGRYALVLEKGKNFTKIYYNNAVGYIRTDCLKFYPIATEPWPEGLLSLNGYTNGLSDINIRNKPEHGSHICDLYQTGTAIRVIEIGDTWTEVEINRVRGYIQAKFLTMPE